jgi:hypothetical protein
MIIYLKSSELMHTATALTRDVFPAFCRPTKESSISCLKNKLKKENTTAVSRIVIIWYVLLQSQQNSTK